MTYYNDLSRLFAQSTYCDTSTQRRAELARASLSHSPVINRAGHEHHVRSRRKRQEKLHTFENSHLLEGSAGEGDLMGHVMLEVKREES